jgi:hypothetical protein
MPWTNPPVARVVRESLNKTEQPTMYLANCGAGAWKERLCVSKQVEGWRLGAVGTEAQTVGKSTRNDHYLRS